MINQIKVALKGSIPVYRYYRQAMNQLSIWKVGLYPPGHYYSPVVSQQRLPEVSQINYDESIDGVDLKESTQLLLLNSLRGYYQPDQLPTLQQSGFRYYYANDYFSFSDGITLSLLMQHVRPRQIIEVGSGFSSALVLDINDLYFESKIKLTFIEPYPEERLNTLLKDTDKNSVLLIKDFVQNADLQLFKELEKGDILFIDSSHISKYGSDLNFILFRVLPILRSGVVIHFHDVFFPFEYPLEWLKQGRSWNEAYLIRAFLSNNNAFEILLFTSFMEGKHKKWYEDNMPMCLKLHEEIKVGSEIKLMNTTGQSLYLVKK